MLVSSTSMKAAPATMTPIIQGLNFGRQGSGGACAVGAGGVDGAAESSRVAVSAMNQMSGSPSARTRGHRQPFLTKSRDSKRLSPLDARKGESGASGTSNPSYSAVPP